MKYLQTIVLFLCCFFHITLHAEEQEIERVYIHTDKNCYVAGEDIWVKFYVVNRGFKPSSLSKVGYVEICDTEKPQMQLKVALNEGSGSGKIKIPANLSSGVYQLSGYTRLMRNEGDSLFFKTQIAILNVGKPSLPDQVKLIGPDTKTPKVNLESSNVGVKTDKREYLTRDLVQLSLDNLPENVSDLVVSVRLNDSILSLSGVDNQKWLKQVAEMPTTLPSLQWLPEYEGHIVTGQLSADSQDGRLISNIAFVGDDIKFINGKKNPDKTVSFYTTGVYGSQEVVTSVVPTSDESSSYHINIVSPFCAYLPEKLPELQVYPNNKRLVERYIAVQLQSNSDIDSTDNQISPESYYDFPILYSYDLDNYKRFNSLNEMFTEYVNRLNIEKVNNKKVIRVFSDKEHRFNVFEALILLDGVPVYNHEDILNYNPRNLKKINIYDGRYVFGDITFECIVSFVSINKNLPFFQLGKESQLFKYECPSLPVKFKTPDYTSDLAKKSRKPDFRHTLYWNPDVKRVNNKPVQLSFFTSDLSGQYEVVVEGITSDGKIIYQSSYFEVKE